jgi:threonine/homoserine/homoserine lactone efflux protein
MDLSFFARGFVIGLSIAAPVGPIGVLCIRRTLAEGRAIGFVSGLGAATADALYGAVAAFGLTAISGVLVQQQFWLQLIGGAFLCWLGYKTFIAPPAEKSAAAPIHGLARAYTSTLFLTLTNPATILSFVAVFAGLGLGAAAGSYSAASLMVAGVFLGSAAWWLFLSGGIGLLREQIGPHHLRWINRLSGALLLAFGLAALWSTTK